MGTPRGGNGDEQPPGGGGPFDGFSGMPPEWGPVVIPDDLSALDEEAAAIRKQFRREARRDRWRRRLRLSAPGTGDTPSLGVPLAIMAIAVVATMISLFAVAWPGGYDGGSPNADGVTTRSRPLTLPDLSLRDTDGVPVRIRDAAPAVILLVDGCSCERVIAELAQTVDPRVSVLVVATPVVNPSASAGAPGAVPGVGPGGASAAPGGAASQPAPGPGPGPGPKATPSGSTGPSVSARPDPSGPPGVRVRRLLDPAGALRASVPGLPSPATVAGPTTHGVLLLVSSDWAVVQVVPTTTAIGDLKGDLDRLAG